MRKGNKKDFTAQTFKLNSELVERLNHYSETTGVSKTFAVERAIEKYLDKKEQTEH